MNPFSIYLRNVRTYDEVRLDLPEGLLALIGPNGAGKSTLISAIDVALFGPDGRSLAPWYPRGIGEEPLVIELVFEHAGEIYRVRRSFSPKGRGMSRLDLERADVAMTSEGDQGVWEPLTLESQSATEAYLGDLIGLSRATFRASSYLAQGESGAFCDAQPRERKAILSEVADLGEWDRFLERARSEKRACETEIAQVQALLERAADELGQREQAREEWKASEGRVQALVGDLQNGLAALTAARERRAEALRQVERRAAAEAAEKAAQAAEGDLRRRLREREEEILRLDQRLARRDELERIAALLAGHEQERESLREALSLWQERTRISAEVAQISGQAQQHLDEASRLERQATITLAGVGEEHCDRCGQVLGEEAAARAANSFRADAARYGEEAQALTTRAIELATRLTELPSTEPDHERLPILNDLIQRAQEATSAVAALDEIEARRQVATGELDKMRAELPAREADTAASLAQLSAFGPHDPGEAENARLEVERLERTEQALRERLDSEQGQLARYDERLARLASIEDEAQEKQVRLERLQQSLELRLALERACSANGIPALILESVAIPHVEAEATRLLRVLGGPATAVELRTLRETKTGGVSDTLDIVLQTETGEANYETFSGGERARIAFALRLSLAQLLAGRKGAETGLLVIDEIDGLDQQGIAALVLVLEDLQARVPRIIVVSHDMNLRDAFANTLQLVNEDGRSRIVDSAPMLVEAGA